MADISASLSSSVVTDLIDGLSYPFKIELDGNRLDDPGDRMAEGRWGDDISEATEEDESIGEAILDAAITGYLEARDGGARTDPSDGALYTLFENAIGNPPNMPTNVSEVRAILVENRGGFTQQFVSVLNALRGVEIDWIKITVVKKPGAALGNPIRITNLNLKVQAKAKLCARVFGQEHCIRATTPNVEFQAHELRAAFDVRGSQVWAVPSAKGLDLVIRVRILGVRFTFTIGITKVTNKFLASKSTMVFDASTLTFPLPTFGKTFAISGINIPASATATTLELDGQYRP